MGIDTFGFVEAPALSNHDHVFGAWLRKHGADMVNVRKRGDANMWNGPDGRVLAMAFYDNAACTYVVWVREDTANV